MLANEVNTDKSDEVINLDEVNMEKFGRKLN